MTQRSKLLKILLIFTSALFLSGTLPAFVYSNQFSELLKTSPEDTSQIILFLDTAVLGQFFFPVNGKVISPYGRRGTRMHTGTDIKLAHGDTVRAAFSGVVTKSSSYFGYGILVVLKHPYSIETYYAHLSKALVNDGDTVLVGSPIGLGGRTGRATTEHLHFEIRKNGKPLNSEHFFDFNGLSIKSLVLHKKPEKVKVEEKEETAEKVVAEQPAEEKEVITKVKETSGNANIEKKYHTVRKGDTLFSLSRKYGKTVDDICKLNNIRKSSVLKIGKKLRVN